MQTLNLDIQTVLILLFLGNLTLVFVLAAYKSGPEKNRVYRQFLAGKLFQSIAFLLFILRGGIADFLSIQLGNYLLLIGYAFEMIAVINSDTPYRNVEKIYAIIAGAGIIAFWLVGSAHPNIRVGVSSLAIGALCFTSVIYLFTHPKGSRLRHAIGMFYAILSLVLFMRMGTSLISSDFTLYSQNISQNLTFFVQFLFLLTSGVAFLLLLKEHDDQIILESECRFRNLFEYAPVGIFHSTVEGQFLTANPALVKMLGYSSPGELISSTTDMSRQIYAEPQDRLQVLQSVRNTEGWIHYEGTKWQRRDGTLIFVDLTMRRVVKSTEKLTYLECFIIDITERRLAEQALVESESFNRGLVENLPDYIVVYGLDGKILYVNPAASAALGYHTDEVVMHPLLSFIPEVLKERTGDFISARMGGRDTADYEVDILTRDNTKRTVIVKGAQIQYQNSQAILLLLVDITQRKLYEQILKENEEKFRSIFEETPDPILILNSAYQVIEVNNGFETFFECKNEEITGKHSEELGINLTAQTLSRFLEKMGHEGYAPHEEMVLLKRTDTPFTAEIAISRILIHDESSLLIQIHDIDTIRRARDAVHEVNRKLKILSSVTRHDILNRIMVTLAYSDFLQEELTEPGHIKKLNAITQSSQEIQNLIEFTGQYQELGETAPSWQSIDFILQKTLILKMLSRVEVHSGLKGIEIYADNMLEKVVYNLVENSIRHGKKLSSIRLSRSEENGILTIVYEDDGGGIPFDEKKKAFEKGFGKNTGLGLFLIREILSITGISIIENGEPGIGVRFEISVPPGKWREIG